MSKHDVGVVSLVIHARLGSQGVLARERDKLRKGAPHFTE